jgi:hypothetical protein
VAIPGRFEANVVEAARVQGEGAVRGDPGGSSAIAGTISGPPLREGAWRLAMRVADALGDDQGVVRADNDCEQALADLGTTPSESTRQLLGAPRH